MGETAGSGALSGVKVIERARGVAAAYAGRLLATVGADVTMLEPQGGSPLRRTPPFLDPDMRTSALFAYLAAGKRSMLEDETSYGAAFNRLIGSADILLDDTPVDLRAEAGLDPKELTRCHPQLIFVSVLPFGAVGPHARWRAQEINSLHAGGEGALLPNGLALELFPDRPPVKIYGHFAMYQGGTSAAIAAIAAMMARPQVGGQFVDISVQDANLAVGAFAIQRLGEGVVENRRDRSFRYGGVVECRDGFIQVLTLENRQWEALCQLMGDPDWARDPGLKDPMERGRRGSEINGHLRTWALTQKVEVVVERGQRLGVPVARYNSPREVLQDPHVRERRLFEPIDIPQFGTTEMLVAPYKLSETPPDLSAGPPELGSSGRLSEWAGEPLLGSPSGQAASE